ncbi:MAG: carbohydrate kinase [Firmicutes bacterium]|nr:carbohydrate kinase [Bacillota bacterium]
MSEYLIGIDAGTSVVKCVLYDAAGRQVARAATGTEISRPQPGWCEQDMNALAGQVEATLAELVAKAPAEARRVRAIGISAQGDGTWLVDEEGRPVRPALLWLDARAASVVRRWQEDGTADRLFALTWTAPCVSLQPPQLRWLQENEPDTLARTHAVLHAGDWIFYRLTGILSSERSQVGHTYFLRRSETFSAQTFSACGIEPWLDRIPPVRDGLSAVGTLRPAIAERTGLPAGLPVAGPLFDVCASAIGLGALHDGDVCTIMGSAAIHEMTLAEPSPVPNGIGYNIVMGPKNRWLRMLSSMAGTLNVDWFLKTIGVPASSGQPVYTVAENMVSGTSPGAGGLIYLPFIDAAGERSPFVNDAARAMWFGLHSGLEKRHMLRAVYEGVAMAARDSYEHMPKPFSTVRAAGGGAKSAAWMGILADVSGKVVNVFAEEECGALGAALAAGTASGLYSSLEEGVGVAVRIARQIEPDPKRMEYYDERYGVYKALLSAVLPLWEERAAAASGAAEAQ